MTYTINIIIRIEAYRDASIQIKKRLSVSLRMIKQIRKELVCEVCASLLESQKRHFSFVIEQMLASQ